MENRGGEEKARLAWIDVARGIGILAVVAGHVWTRGAMRDAFYSFHMPLFFLLSGVLARPQPVGAFTVRQIAGQMRPYAAFLVLLLGADWLIETMKGGRPIFHDWPRDLIPVLLGGTWLRGPFTIFWFVPCLMLARIAYNAVLARWPDPAGRIWWAIAPGIGIVAYAAGMATDLSPLGLLTVPMAFILLWAGHRWQGMAWRAWMWAVVLALALPGLLGWWPTLNMKAGNYGWPLLSMASAVATSLLIFALARRLAARSAWIAAVGRASLVIMYLHVALIHYLTPYVSAPWRLAAALIVPLALYHLFRATALRRVFL